MKTEEIKRLVAKSENGAVEFKRAKGSEMKAEKQRLKTAGYISLHVAEVYLVKTCRKTPLDILPFEGDKLPQGTKEAF